MARRPTTRVRVEEDTRGLNLSMAAPSFVNAQSDTAVAAAQLADALGVGRQMVDATRAQRAQEGLRDAALGQVDPERMERQRAYREAVEVSQTEAGWLHVRSGIDEELSQLDLTQIPPDQHQQLVDEVIDRHLREAYGDPESPQLSKTEAAALAPRVAQYRQKAHEGVIETNRRLAYESAVNDTRDSLVLRLEEGEWSEAAFNEWASIATERLGKGRQSREALLSLLAEQAISRGQPELLEAVPERWPNGAPTFRTDAQLAPRYADALDKARTAQSEAAYQAQTIQRIETYEGFWMQAQAGALDIDALNRAVTPDELGNSLITEGQARDLRTMNARARLEDLTKVSYAHLIFEGRGALIESASDQQRALQEALSMVPPEQQTNEAIRLGVANGILPAQHENIIGQANPTNPEMFLAAVDLYSTYEAQFPGFLAAHMADEDLKLIVAYNALRDAGWTEEQALESLREADWKLVSEIDNREYNEYLEKATREVQDVPWTWNNLKDNPALRREIRSIFDTLIANNVPPEDAAKAAVEYIRDTRVYIDGAMYHRNEGWPYGEEQNAADAYVRHFVTTNLPDEDPDDFYIQKSLEPGYVHISRHGDWLPGYKVPISEIGAWWPSEKHRVTQEAARARAEKLERQYARKAMDRVYPVRFTGDATADNILHTEQVRYWESLPEHARRAALEEIAAEEERANARKQQQRETFRRAYQPENIHY